MGGTNTKSTAVVGFMQEGFFLWNTGNGVEYNDNSYFFLATAIFFLPTALASSSSKTTEVVRSRLEFQLRAQLATAWASLDSQIAIPVN